ncbi:MAG: zf-HC2 domain-containing protein [Gemmatimonadota bacterium]|nr:zf-HC2 domain-containing protein [Gemmatimonadota bacterium]
MTDCPRADVRDVLPDWVHGTLDAATHATVSSHVARCAECRAEAEMLRGMRAVLRAAPVVDTARIAGAVRQARSRQRLFTPWRAGIGVVALAASLVAAAVLVRNEPRGAPGAGAGLPIATAPSGSAPHVVDSLPALQGSSRAPQAASAESASTLGPSQASSPRAGAAAELSMGGGIGDLADDDLEALLVQLDRVDALPHETPEPVVTTLTEGRS